MTDGDDGPFIKGTSAPAVYSLEAGSYVCLLHMDQPDTERRFALVIRSQTPLYDIEWVVHGTAKRACADLEREIQISLNLHFRMTENIPPCKIYYVQFNRIIIFFYVFLYFFFRPHQMEWNSKANLLVAFLWLLFYIETFYKYMSLVPNIMSFDLAVDFS